MAETTGVAELIVRVKDEASKQMKQLAKVLQSTLDPDQWAEVKAAMEAMGVEVDNLAEDLDRMGDRLDDNRKKSKKASKGVNEFKDVLNDTSEVAESLGANVGGINNQLSSMLTVLTRVNPLLAAVGATVGAGVIGFNAAADVGAYAKELSNLAEVGNVTTQELQAFAAATETVGFDLSKTADILKDVNDRIGDFTSTGGGALQDYFDALGAKVSYTAQELENMSTLEAITAIQDDLEANNVSVERQIFLWESLSGEAAKMIPLIKDNAAELKKLADEAEQRGGIFTDAEIQQAKEFDKTLKDLSRAASTLWRRIGIAAIPVLEGITDKLEKVTEFMESINRLLASSESSWTDWINKVNTAGLALASFTGNAVAIDAIRESLEGTAEAADNIKGDGLDGLRLSLKSAEAEASKVSAKLLELRDIEEYLQEQLNSNALTDRARLKAVSDLAEVQAVINGLVQDEAFATDKVLQARQALLVALDKQNEASTKATQEQAKKAAEDGIQPLSQVAKELLDGYKAELLNFYADTGKTLQSRLSAVSQAVRKQYEADITKLKNMGVDAGIIESLISQETARAQFDLLSTEFDRVSTSIELRAAKVGRQVANGIISESEGIAQLKNIYGESGEALESLLSKLEALATQTGSNELKAEVASLQGAVEDFKSSLGEEGFVKPEWVTNLEKTREAIAKLKTELVVDSADLGGIEDALQAAVDRASKPLETLREKVRETLAGDELADAETAIDKALSVAQVNAKMDVLETVFQARVAGLNAILSGIKLDLDAGIISEADAADQVAAAYANVEPEIQKVLAAMNLLATETGSPTLITRAIELQNQFQQLGLTVEETSSTMVEDMAKAGAEAAGGSLAQGITDLITQAEDLGDVFDAVMEGILKAMLEVVQSQVAKQFTNILVNAAASSFGGGGGVAQAFATGGYVRGAGTTKSDSIRAWLSDKEFVQPADATAYYGVAFMELLRRKAIPKELLMSLMGSSKVSAHTPRVPRFSSGGLVSGNVLAGTESGARGDLNVTLVQVKDEKEAQAYLKSKRGGEDLLGVISENKSQIKSILG